MPSFQNSIKANKYPIRDAVLDSASSAPASPVEGQAWTDTVAHYLKMYLNGGWRVMIDDRDSRLTDSRTPTGAAGGDLTGTYPNPTIGVGKVTSSHILDGTITDADVNAANKDGASGTASMRTIGTGAAQAMAGNTRLDTIAAPTGSVSLNSQKITNLLDPTSAQDAATKAYVDGVVQGLDAKASVVWGSTGVSDIDTWGLVWSNAQVLAIFGGSSNATSDFPVGTRVLIRTDGQNRFNGIYVVTANSGTNVTFARSADMDNWNEVPGAFTFVEKGTIGDTGWVSTADAGGSLNGTAITWVQFSSAGSYTAGSGLTLTGVDFSVNVDGSSIEIFSDTLRVKALGITNAMLAGAIDLTSKVTGILPIANGGTGASSAAAARTALGAAGMVVLNSPVLVADTYATLTHNLNNEYPVVSVYDATGKTVEYVDIISTGVNTIQMKIGAAASASAFKVTVVG